MPNPPAISHRQGIVAGLLFGLGMGVFTYFDDGRVWSSVITAVLTGAFFGFVMDRVFVRQQREALRDLGPLSRTATRGSVRAAVSGPLSDDPATRSEQERIVGFRLKQAERTFVFSMIVFAVFTVLGVVQALTSSPWFWLVAALFAGLLLLTPLNLSRLRRRQRALLAVR